MSEQTSFRVIEERGGLRCPYCHGDVLEEEAQEACGHCNASHHLECWDAHGGCSACGRLANAASVGAAPSAASQLRAPSTGRRAQTSLGGRANLRYEHTDERAVLEWGSNVSDAKTGLLIGLISLLLVPIGLLIAFAINDPVFVMMAFMYSLSIPTGVLIYNASEVSKAGRLTIDERGLHRSRFSFWGRYLPGGSIPWSGLKELSWNGSQGNYRVTARLNNTVVELARFRFQKSAVSFIGHVQRARARLAREVDASIIRIRPITPDSK